MKLRHCFPLLIMLLIHWVPLQAQMIYKGIGTSNSTFLLGNVSARHTQCLYLPDDLINPLSGELVTLYYRYGSTGQATGVTLGDLVIRMGVTEATVFNNGNEYFTQLTDVFQTTSYTIPPGTTGEWFPITLDVPFSYNAFRSLIIDISFNTSTAGTFGTLGTSNSGRKLYSGTVGTTTGLTTSTTWQDMGFDLNIGTGIQHMGLRASNLYPNPFSEQLWLDVQGPLAADAQIEVLDLAGRAVIQVRAGGHDGPLELDLARQPAGIYLLRIVGTSEQMYLGQVVKH